jgi:hypothetical protein
MKAMRKFVFIFILAAASLGACNLPRRGGEEVSQEDRVMTAAAQTVAALNTMRAPGYTPPPGSASVTPSHTASTPTPAGTASPTSTPTSSEPCNRASFEGDATIPDGSVLPPNTRFTKTWLVKNTGSCVWKGYSAVFAERGSALSDTAVFPLLGEVKPGETARISVDLAAPGDPGEYEGYWRLRSDQNQEFGTGASGAGDFFVKIQVADEYAFASLACSAEWSTGAGPLPCPGKESDAQGYVVLAENPAMEDSQEREGPGLLVFAQPVAGGYIVGKFPPVIVPTEADFRATLGCQPGASGCFVRFRVTYRVDGGDEELLGEWNEGSEGGITNAIKDLDMVGGRSTAFTFYLTVAGTPEQSKGVWFNPRIVK